MTPEDVPRNGTAERLSRLERTVASQGSDIARIQSDVSNNTQMIRALAPLVSQLATVAEAQRNLKDAMTELRHDWRQDVKHFDQEIEKIATGQERDQQDSKNFRRMLYVTIVAAVLSPIGTLLVAVVSQG
jgi:chromosome segregation ATPase